MTAELQEPVAKQGSRLVNTTYSKLRLTSFP